MSRVAYQCLTWIVLAAPLLASGCASLHSSSRCETVGFHVPQAAPAAEGFASDVGGTPVDADFLTCWRLWSSLTGLDASQHEDACEAYNAAVWRLVQSAGRCGRLDPHRGLTVCLDGATVTIPVQYHGFAWQPSDFQRLHVPPCGHEPLLDRRYGCAGIGFPLVVERWRRDCDPLEARFLPEKSFFNATVVLEFPADAAAHDPASCALGAELRFYDPHSHRRSADGRWKLAANYSAALAQTLEAAPRSYFAGFIEPGSANTRPRLNLLEPYRPGKIPVVLIHGLFSDPLSWADMVNDLRATPAFTDRFQIWVFRYPTGRGFLQSATALRQELRAVTAALDPEAHDPALHNMVLIGHSMGGLIAKLQVTYSDELIWNKLANRPLETIVTTEPTRAFLAENCYFDPSPNVGRVIFIAAPHSGSSTASGLIGQAASLLVEPAPEQEQLHEQLLRDNSHTFNPLIERRMPTSIDMLSPQSPLLAVMKCLRFKRGLTLHNIIGVHSPLTLDGPSDGVVSVRSASHPYCQSVLAFNAPHAKVHRSPRASCEVLRILNAHAACPDPLHP